MSKETDIKENVLARINAGSVTMRSRAYFVLRAVLVGAGALLALAVALFALSFVFFSVRESGVGYLLEFGERGIGIFVMLFPWTSLLAFVALTVVIELLVRRFAFAYRTPLLRVFLWVLTIGIIGGTLLGFTPLHARLLFAADRDRLPFLGPWYEQVHDSHTERGVYRGDVTAVNATYFTLSHNDVDRDSDEGVWSVQPPAGFDLNTIMVGDKAYVAGRLKGGVVYAYGVHIVRGAE